VVRSILGGVGTPTNDADPATKVYVDRYAPVVGRATPPAGTDGSSGTGNAITTYARTGRTIHKVIGAAAALKLEYTNWYTQPNSPGEVANANSITIRAAIEYPAGKLRQISGSTAWNSATAYAALDQVTYLGAGYVALITTTVGTAPTAALGTQWQLVTRYPAQFAGQDTNRAVTVTAGSTVTSLPMLLSIAEGQYLAVTTTANSGGATGQIPADYVGTGSMDFALDYPTTPPVAGSTDLVDINATTQTTLATGTRVPMPSAILGLGRMAELARYVTLVGDSLMMGYLDTAVDSFQKGYGVRAAEYEAVRYRRITQGGDRMQYWTPANATRRITLAAVATAVLCDFGSNDIANSRTLAQLQADSLVTWTALGNQGARVWQRTILPRTTSTDGWATKANQTPVATGFAAGGVRQTYNTWLRAGASTVINGVTLTMGMTGHPLSGIVDISSVIEDPTDSNYWKSPGYTTDGAHGTALSFDLLAQAMRGQLTPMLTGTQPKWTTQRIVATIAAANTAGYNTPGAVVYHTGLKRWIYFNGSVWDIPYDTTPGADWSISIDQALGTAVSTLLTWPVSNVTAVGISTSAGVQTITQPGWWDLSLNIRYSTANGNYAVLSGSSATNCWSKGSTPTSFNACASVKHLFAAGDTFRCYGYAGGGGNATKENAGDTITGLTATWLGP
jgi:hypothetical protein